jgi:hypothetical protein
MHLADTPTPELQTMTLGEHDLVEFGNVKHSDGVLPELRKVSADARRDLGAS